AFEFTNDSYRRLLNLQIFDTLCAQVDRHEGNYMVKVDTKQYNIGDVTDFKGIDNDMSFGTLKYKDVCKKGLKGHMNMTKITDEKGDFALPAVEEEFALKILALQEEQLRFEMADLLDDDEMDALVDRIKGVQDLLKTAMDKNKNLLISKEKDTFWTKSKQDFKKQGKDDESKLNYNLRFTYFPEKFFQ
ncbi:MAG: hypothetical protein J6N76_09765, partial [Lachnospiraceae bacterium]|nr:hypothetical protein [Lachnospiraceae bacterium]